ncbi:MAG: hypothetical protein GY708_08350 [Actinomycetia bacterium]|nr:hypothetical protein [Actinomycetes bacterium]MCP4958699.1 hypothetical protein [Actinomycetes bacterium]
MSHLAIFLVVGALTLVIRGWAVVAVGLGFEVTPAMTRTLRLVGPAVLSAIAANSLFVSDGHFSANWAWCLAALIAAASWLKWRSGGISFVTGFVAVSILTQLM